MIKAPDAWGFSLFCDDIRNEIGGKTTIVGIYQVDMLFPSEITFPFIIPKMGIFIKYYERPGALKEDLNLHVYFPGNEKDKPTFMLPIPRATMYAASAPVYPIEEDQERVGNLTFPIVMGPIPIAQEGFIKVRMHCGDVIVPLGSLRIAKMMPIKTDTP